MAPTAQSADQGTTGGAAEKLITVSRAQIAQVVATHKVTSANVGEIASALQLNSGQVSALIGGSADLQLTQAQYDNLRASAAAAYAEAGSTEGTDVLGSLCGSSGSPSSATTAKTVPSVTTQNADVAETNAGTTVKSETVGVGKVTIRTDVQGTVGSRVLKNLFSFTYKGADSKDAHWLQFIHREIIGVHADASVHEQTGAIATTGGSYDLTTGGTATTFGVPTEANYNTDTAGSDPFYESGGVGNRTADSTTIFDQPSAADARVQAAFSAGATRVISRAHFDTFLVQTDHVTYQIRTTVTYDFASATAKPVPVTSATSLAANALPGTIAKRFHAQWPAFAFIK